VRILFLTQWFQPEPHYKGLPFAKELQRRGHEVTVLTGFPNYPGGKIYEGYRIRLWQRERMDGINVLRVPLYPSHDRSRIGRILNYVSFATAATAYGLVKTGAVDVVYAYHPPATVGLPALALQWLRRIPCVYDVQDLWPDTLSATGMLTNRFFLKLAGLWSNFVYRRATHVVVLSDGFKAKLVDRGVDGKRITVIHNWSPDEGGAGQAAPLGDEERAKLSGRFNVVFAGNIGAAQGLGTVLAAAEDLLPTDPNVQFVLVGGGIEVEPLRAEATKRGLRNVLFLPRRPAAAMGQIYELADVLLVHLRDNPLFAITIPSKVQTYLAAGRPILVAMRGDAARLVEASGAGICCEPGDPVALAAGVRRLLALPPAARRGLGEAGRRYYSDNLDLNHGVSKFEELFRMVAGRRHEA